MSINDIPKETEKASWAIIDLIKLIKPNRYFIFFIIIGLIVLTVLWYVTIYYFAQSFYNRAGGVIVALFAFSFAASAYFMFGAFLPITTGLRLDDGHHVNRLSGHTFFMPYTALLLVDSATFIFQYFAKSTLSFHFMAISYMAICILDLIVDSIAYSFNKNRQKNN